MKQHYRITPQGRGPEPSDAEIARLADGKRLLYDYQRATRRPSQPIYRDPKAFLLLLLIVLIAWLVSGGFEKEQKDGLTVPEHIHPERPTEQP
ncbi:MAG: hypothetical protein IPO05_04540 [Flavobacteriales bacterium]|jgi:hypothetical protein|nr:hypothetical protein [Flavobacteriales bacterium]MBK9512894.1 hypothetical protein [Flavobacteriales bacterium]MBP7449279.1 hypothetical protein [Flavobacteriales bacterium]HOZ41263.1 hypothetical protein [Flavobacteriales bacterium]